MGEGLPESADNPSQVVQIAEYLDFSQAHLDHGRLLSADIPATLADEHMSQLLPTASIRLLVPSRYAQRARDILGLPRESAAKPADAQPSMSGIGILAMLPLRVAHAVGGLVGVVLSWFPNRHRRIARVNIDLCFPTLPAKARARLCRAGLRETGKGLLEIGALWRWDLDRLFGGYLSLTADAERLLSQFKNQAAVYLLPHLGAWELAGIYLQHHRPLVAMYRPPRRAHWDPVLRQARSRNGIELVSTDARGVRQIIQAVRSGKSVLLLPDQDPPRSGGVFAPFFGVATHTAVLAPRLASKLKLPVYVVFAERLAHGAGYRLHAWQCDDAIYDKDLNKAAVAMNREMERAVMIAPEQYQWTYKRFKTRPPGERTPYPKRKKSR